MLYNLLFVKFPFLTLIPVFHRIKFQVPFSIPSHSPFHSIFYITPFSILSILYSKSHSSSHPIYTAQTSKSIHQVTTMIVTSARRHHTTPPLLKVSYFQVINTMLTTSTKNPTRLLSPEHEQVKGHRYR